MEKEKNNLIKVELTLKEWEIIYMRLSCINPGMTEKDFDSDSGDIHYKIYKVEQKLIKQIETLKQTDFNKL